MRRNGFFSHRVPRESQSWSSHTLNSLVGRIESRHPDPVPFGLEYVLRYSTVRGATDLSFARLLTGSSLPAVQRAENRPRIFVRAPARHGVTHISGTPSHWRRALMSPAAHLLAPEYARLSGEIADQAILNQLHSFYPQARISMRSPPPRRGLRLM